MLGVFEWLEPKDIDTTTFKGAGYNVFKTGFISDDVHADMVSEEKYIPFAQIKSFRSIKIFPLTYKVFPVMRAGLYYASEDQPAPVFSLGTTPAWAGITIDSATRIVTVDPVLGTDVNATPFETNLL